MVVIVSFIIGICLFFILVCKIGSEMVLKDVRNLYSEAIISRKTYRNLVENRIKKMDGYEFEDFCADIFRLNGYKVFQTKRTGDGGLDLILNKDTYVEIKHYSENNTIGRPIVQKLIGACVTDNITKAIIITTSSYTTTAIECMDTCKAVKVERWYMNEVLELCDKSPYTVLEWLGYKRSYLKTLGILDKVS